MRDYCPSKKEQEKLKIKKSRKSSKKKKKKRTNSIFLAFLFFFLIFLISFLVFLAVRKEFTRFYQVKSNRSVLLLQEDLPRAFLFFNLDEKELLVVDLKDFDSFIDFDKEKFAEAILEEASFSTELEKRIFYSFLLDKIIDESFDYPNSSIKESDLLDFFKDKKKYLHFLKDQENSWRELSFNSENFADFSKNLQAESSFFDCPVAIINTTDQAGLAKKLASLLEKISFLIIKKGSNQENLEKSYFVYDPQLEQCQPLLDKLREMMPETKVVADHFGAQEERAGLVIYIGQDLADLYFLFINLFHSHL